MKIRVHVEGPDRTININMGLSDSRGTKHKREIEGIGETTEIRVQIKKARK